MYSDPDRIIPDILEIHIIHTVFDICNVCHTVYMIHTCNIGYRVYIGYMCTTGYTDNHTTTINMKDITYRNTPSCMACMYNTIGYITIASTIYTKDIFNINGMVYIENIGNIIHTDNI